MSPGSRHAADSPREASRPRPQRLALALLGMVLLLASSALAQVPGVGRPSTLTAEQRKKLAEADELLDRVSRHNDRDQYKEAIPLARRAADLYREVLGPQHADLAKAQDWLGWLFYIQGDYPSAEPPYLRALEIREKALGNEDRDTGDSCYWLGALYERQGKYDKAEPYYRRALDIRQKACGEISPEYGGSLLSLGALHLRAGDLEKAEAPLRQALKVFRGRSERPEGKAAHDAGAATYQLNRAFDTLAELYDTRARRHEAKEEFDAARKARQDLLGLRVEQYGEKHWRTADARRGVAAVQRLAALGREDRARLAEATRLMDEVRKCGREGKYAEALEPARRALALRRRVLGEDDADTAVSLSWLGWLYEQLDEYSCAETPYREALAVRRKILGIGHPDYAESLHELGHLYYEKSEYPRAEALLREAVEVRRTALGEVNDETARSMNQLANIYYAQEKYDQAEPLYQKAIDVQRQVLGERSAVYATTVNNLANLYYDRQKDDLALPLYRKALDTRTHALGPTHADTLSTLTRLAKVLGREADRHEAESRFDLARNDRAEALTLWTSRHGRDHWQTIDARWALERVERLSALNVELRQRAVEADRLMAQVEKLNQQGEYRGALDRARRAADIRKGVLGEDHPQYAFSLQWQGWLHYQLSEYVEGERFYQQALAIQKKALGEYHPAHATCLYELGQLYRVWGKPDRAEEAYRQALAIRKKVLGEEADDTLATMNDLGLVYVAQRDFARAEPLLRQVLDLRKRLPRLGEKHPYYALSLSNLGWCLDCKGEEAEAEELYRRAIALRKEILTPNHPDTVLTQNNLAELLERRASRKEQEGDWGAAVEARRGVLAIRVEVLGAKHWRAIDARLAVEHARFVERLGEKERGRLREAVALLDRVRTLAAQRKHGEAVAPARAAVDIRREVLGEKARPTVDAMLWLAFVQADGGAPAQAEPLARRCLELYAGLLGEEHPEFANALIVHGRIAFALGDHAKAEGLLRRALQIREHLYSPAHADAVKVLEMLETLYTDWGKKCFQRTDYPGLRRAASEVLAVRERLFGAGHWRVTDARWDLRRAEWLVSATPGQRQQLARAEADLREVIELNRTGRLQQALQVAGRLVADSRALRGEQHPDHALALSWWGWLFYRTGDYDRAEPLLRQVAEIDGKILGEKHPRFAEDLYTLGECYWRAGIHARAESVHRRALQIRKEVLGEDHLDYAKSLHALGIVLIDALQEPAAAEPLLRQALDIRRRRLPANHPDTASTMLWLGWTYAKMNDLVRAEPLLREALAIRNRDGTAPPDRVNTLVLVASFYAMKEDFAQAERLYREAIEVAAKSAGEPGPVAQQPREQLARLYEVWAPRCEAGGDLDAARRVWGDLADLRAILYGADSWQAREGRAARARVERLARLTAGERRQVEEAARLADTARKEAAEGRLTEALASAGRALRDRERLLGDRDADTAASLFQVAALHEQKGDPAAAEPLYRRALEVRAALYGDRHPDVAAVLDRLVALVEARARRAEDAGDFRAAVGARREAKALRTRRHGADRWEVVDAGWRLERAERCGRLSADALRRLREADHLLADARTLAGKGKFREGLEPAQRARDVYRELLGENHPDHADALYWLGSLHDALGDYARAEPFWRQARDVRRRTLTESHPEYAASLDGLGWLYFAMRDYARAEPLWRQALAIRREALGERHPLYARSLNNLWLLYSTRGDAARAEPLYRELLAVHRQAWGEEHPEFAASLEVLGDYYKYLGDEQLARSGGRYARGEPFYLRAEALHRQVQQIRKKTLGEEHADYARSLERLGELAVVQGDFARAETLLEQALRVRARAQSKEHPDYAQSLYYRGMLDDARGRPAEAERAWGQALAAGRRNLELTFAVQSERQQLLLTRGLRLRLDAYLSLATRHAIPAEQVYRHVLAWKGAVFARQQRLRLERLRPELAEDFARLRAVTAQLANLAFATPAPGERDAWRRRLQELTRQKDRLEGDLARRSSEFQEQRGLTNPDFTQVQKALRRGTALLDFLEYEYSPRPGAAPVREQGSRHLLAFVLRPGLPVVRRDLGPVAPVADAVERWRRLLKENKGADEAAAEVRRLVWQPLEAELEGAETVLISPDGALARAPLCALPGARPGSYLLEERTLAVLPIPQAILPARRPRAAPRTSPFAGVSLLVVGDVEFGALPGQAEAPPAASAAGRGAVRTGTLRRFYRLPGSEEEMKIVQALFQQTYRSGRLTVSRGAEATEAAFRRLAPGNSYLHLATHGFFAPSVRAAPEQGRPGDRPGLLSPAPLLPGSPALLELPPGLTSGLALAGANRGFSPAADLASADDGILTALDVAELNLSGTDLVVLSACETGLGEEASGEGLLGVQRAFQVAGARHVVASLWQVDDETTRRLMASFYDNLWRKRLPPAAALRQAQLEILRGGAPTSVPRGPGEVVPETPGPVAGRRDPWLWAAWVLSGDPAQEPAPLPDPRGDPVPAAVSALAVLLTTLSLLGWRARQRPSR